MSHRKLAIVGMGRGWKDAPWHNRAYECWTLNSAWRDVLDTFFDPPPSLTRWFELHSRRYLREEWNGSNLHVRTLSQLNLPIMVQQAEDWPELREPQTFPRTTIRKAFPRGDYHASSLDWMLTYAIWRGYKDIGLWGVGFGPTDAGEPLSARACMEYWIGFAEARGVKVKVHEPTGLFWIFNYTKERTPYHFDDTWRLVEDR